MATDCTPAQIELQGFPKRRRLVASFDGGEITSDGGALLLEQAERATKLLDRFVACFVDHRDAERSEHTVEQLVRQRVYALAGDSDDLLHGRVSSRTTKLDMKPTV